jgi:hypothetical protein
MQRTSRPCRFAAPAGGALTARFLGRAPLGGLFLARFLASRLGFVGLTSFLRGPVLFGGPIRSYGLPRGPFPER